MSVVDLPTGIPSQPENASQPEISSTADISVSLQSQELFSQPSENLSQLDKLLWYQKLRTETTLLWVQCDSCFKWRFIPKVYERHQLPNQWFCELHPEKLDCSMAEEAIPIRIEADLVYSQFSLGSMVLVRFGGWPWWPAMVDDDPDTEQFYWIDELCDIPTFYHVTFFDDKVSRAWIPANKLLPFNSENIAKVGTSKNGKLRERIRRSLKKAEECVSLDFPARLEKFSFVSLYDGPIKTPKHVTADDLKQYDANMKKKYSMDFK